MPCLRSDNAVSWDSVDRIFLNLTMPAALVMATRKLQSVAGPRQRILATVAALVLVASPSVVAQRSDTRAIRAWLADSAPLQPQQIAEVLQAAREEIAYRTLRLSFSPTRTTGPELLMDSDGRPKFVQTMSGVSGELASGGFATPSRQQPQPETHVDVVTLTDYTRQAARYCDGSLAPGELVIEYRNVGGDWSVSARRSLGRLEQLAPIFDTLTGDVPLSDAGHATMAGRPARHLTSPWRPQDNLIEERLPGGGISQSGTIPREPVPPDATEHLWVDEQSMLPLRWSVTMTPPAATPLDYGMFFVYDRSIDLRPWEDVQAPTCIDSQRPRFPLGIR